MNNINKCKSDIILDLNIDDDRFGFATSIDEALAQAETELVVLNETIESMPMKIPLFSALPMV